MTTCPEGWIPRRLQAERLCLEPLGPGHADELWPVLDDVSLRRFTGGQPVGVEQLRARFERQARGWSPDGRARWLNWTVRERASGRALGTVQATVTCTESLVIAELAWVVGSAYQGRGFASEAARLMVTWLRERGVRCLRANIHPRHDASMAVARSIGLTPTDVRVGGEVRWES